MIVALIRWSLGNRLLVLLASAMLAVFGVVALRATPIDALPDLSDVQVIVRTRWPGQAPNLVENQVTYPLTSALLSVPRAKAVRGYSYFGDSFAYVLFDDGVDPYWARSRVAEALGQVQARLPAGARAELGPDASGVGWVYQYALVDRSGGHDLSELTALQDWWLRFELKSVPGVAEVASVGGMVRQYQVLPDPARMLAYGVDTALLKDALGRANSESGGALVEVGEAEVMVRSTGYLASLDDFRAVVLKVGANGVPVLLGDVARVQLGPAMRRGIAELDGQGEVVGGIVVMRAGGNAAATIAAVKSRLVELRRSLPAGVEIVETYDRSQLIGRAVEHLSGKLVEEFIAVALVCLLFLFHLRSALVAIVALPLGVLAAFIVMRWQGINANLMSLGGIAIAIGAMVDAAVVMIENAHKHLEHWRAARPGAEPDTATRATLIADAASEVGPALFTSLMVITLSFVPVFTLEAQEGRLFGPLAYTKTYAMAAAAGLSVTLVPVLMAMFIRGRIPDERANPLSRLLIRVYEPLVDAVLAWPRATLAGATVLLLLTAWPAARLGSEFLPMMDEGDWLYMPTALPGLSAGKGAQLLQQADAMIRRVPEVQSVFGKLGRAESATDPAPLEMMETTVRLKPRDQWRPGMTAERLRDELDRAVRLPGLTNLWVPPIRNRIDMLATGIKSPIGIKVSGPDLATIEQAATAIEALARTVPGVSSALAERLAGGRYLDIDIDRAAAARHGLNVGDVQALVDAAIAGDTLGEVVDGRRRFPIALRYPRELRDTPAALAELTLVAPGGRQLRLADLARVRLVDGPPMLRSENGRLAGWIYVDVQGRDLVSVVEELRARVASGPALPAGVSVAWSGQFEFYEHAKVRLGVVVPATLAIIFVLLYVAFRRVDEALLILATVPFALVGGVWLMWLLGHALSIASAVGFIALAGVAAEFGVVMLLYLKQSWERPDAAAGDAGLRAAIRAGAVQRVRPKAMTVAVILAGLLPILAGHGAGAEITQRIAAPMVGGMLTAPLLSMLLIPAAYLLMRRRA